MTKNKLYDTILIRHINRRYNIKMFSKKNGLWFFGFVMILVVVCFLASCKGKDKINISDSTEPAGETYGNVEELPLDTVNNDTSAVTFPSTVLITGSAGINITTGNYYINTTTTTKKATTTAATTASSTVPATQAQAPTSLKEFQDRLFFTDDPNTAGKILEMAGFVYDPEQVIYYSSLNPLQRKFGFNPLYDAAAPYTGMIYATERFFFSSGGRDWLIQIWKGQYGITVGAEIGIYNKPPDRTSGHYDCVGDEDMVEMTMEVYKNGNLYFTRGPEKHWWLTGFKLLDVTTIVDLKVYFIITLEDPEMVSALDNCLKEYNKENVKYERAKNSFYIGWE